VNAVSTELIDTPQLRQQIAAMADDLGDEGLDAELSSLGEDLPLGQVGDPAMVGDAVLFLGSDAARYTTGHVPRVDGGARLA
jgi:NAD(P)-dependent dehydrogenase (short-subunit alcohol dehydrogenase family)